MGGSRSACVREGATTSPPWPRRSAVAGIAWPRATPPSTGSPRRWGAPRRRRPAASDGLLLVDKPSGMTSHDGVDVERRHLGIRKIGHAGTLDPMATGLLVLGVGRAPRVLRYLGDLPKTYEGAGRLGGGSDP